MIISPSHLALSSCSLVCKRFFDVLEKRAEKNGRIQLGDLALDNEAKMVLWHGKQVDLSPKEFSLLRTLMQNAGKTLFYRNFA